MEGQRTVALAACMAGPQRCSAATGTESRDVRPANLSRDTLRHDAAHFGAKSA